MNVVRIAAALAVLLVPVTEAQARHHHKVHIAHHHRHSAALARAEAPRCVPDNNGRMACSGSQPTSQMTALQPANSDSWVYSRRGGNMRSIPNPPGTWRVARSCAQRLAAYWGLGSGLDKVSTWPDRFAPAPGPGIGIAAVRRDRHHVLGIVGGSPGQWEVVNFNSDGHHGNLSYVAASFPGYFFVNPRVPRFANR